ncbi:MAG TPA: ASKHA domain-containing protein [Syntrophomonas sp.]|nr:ASKHA domain-containing protein [Syntrophomonas sp.]
MNFRRDSMPNIHFIEQNIDIAVASGTTIIEAARAANVEIESPCNAVGTCGKCRVHIPEIEQLVHIKDEDCSLLSQAERTAGYVLACHTKVFGDIEVSVCSKAEENRKLNILAEGESFEYTYHPYITKRVVDGITQVYGGGTLIGTEPGDTAEQTYGIALDIGTTTLVAELIHLPTGRQLASESMLNPQSAYAQDVLTRIHFAAQENGLETLYQAFLSAFSFLRDKMLSSTGIDSKYIYEVIYSGNTTMLHLAAGVDPVPLGKYPYIPNIKGGQYIPTVHLGISPFGLAYLPPIISAFVGADIVSGILVSRLEHKAGAALFIDIGTNGEIVLAYDGSLAATSTAAGPAFEGMNIVCGTRAIPGAVEQFQIDEDGKPFYKTIGNVKASGICGSGLLDITAELVRVGVIGKSGRFAKPDQTGYSEPLKAAMREREGKLAYFITEDVFLTQQDIRQVQLAKGAIRSGITALLDQLSVPETEIDEVLIAGSFGYHLRENSLLNIGLLPPVFAGKVRFIGNTSQSGAVAFLLNQGFRTEMHTLAEKIGKVELADTPDFEKLFVASLGF